MHLEDLGALFRREWFFKCHDFIESSHTAALCFQKCFDLLYVEQANLKLQTQGSRHFMLIGSYLFDPVEGQGYRCKICKKDAVISLANRSTGELGSYCATHLGLWLANNEEFGKNFIAEINKRPTRDRQIE
jgi:hypothetical protein